MLVMEKPEKKKKDKGASTNQLVMLSFFFRLLSALFPFNTCHAGDKEDKPDKEKKEKKDKSEKEKKEKRDKDKKEKADASSRPSTSRQVPPPKARGPPPPKTSGGGYLDGMDLPSSSSEEEEYEKSARAFEEKLTIVGSAAESKKIADRERKANERAHQLKLEALREDDNVFDVAFEGQGDENAATSATDVKVKTLKIR